MRVLDRSAVAAGWQDVTTDRTVTVSGIDRLTANFKASIVVDEVLDIGVVEQKLGKGPGRLARLHASRCLADQGCPSFVVTPGHNVLRFWPRRLTADAIVCLISECNTWSTNS
jgi:hypothetical protein